MELQDAEYKYQELGLEVRHIVDEPGEVYEPHRHEGVYLFTVKGSAQIKLDDGEWRTLEPGAEVHIQDDQLHEATAGPNGWEYLFATSPQEMKRQEL
jgi:quercetin dioxygenase-like cupin family protein